MADLLLDEQATPTTPSSGTGVLYVDSTVHRAAHTDAAGRTLIANGAVANYSTAAQGAGFDSDTYVTGSSIQIPACGLQVGTMIVWTISASKTAASTAQPVYTIRKGAARTTADTAILALTGPAQTAAADIGILTIMATLRNVGASGVLQGTAVWTHNLGTATGFGGAVEGSSAAFDTTAAGGQYLGLSIAGGASSAWTVTQVQVRMGW